MSNHQRGHLTHAGLALLGGQLVLASLLVVALGDCPRSKTAEATWPMVGPFRINVVDVDVGTDAPAGVTAVTVAVHLRRPGGPVPVEQRVRFDGVCELAGPFRLDQHEWIYRNEFGRNPVGDQYQGLGVTLPAPRHAGEVYGVFRFLADGIELSETLHLRFTLPSGEEQMLSVQTPVY